MARVIRLYNVFNDTMIFMSSYVLHRPFNRRYLTDTTERGTFPDQLTV